MKPFGKCLVTNVEFRGEVVYRRLLRDVEAALFDRSNKRLMLGFGESISVAALAVEFVDALHRYPRASSRENS